MTDHPPSRLQELEHELVDAVFYALREGCFFPVPPPKRHCTVRECIQWGAMRNLHTKIAALSGWAAEGTPR